MNIYAIASRLEEMKNILVLEDEYKEALNLAIKYLREFNSLLSAKKEI